MLENGFIVRWISSALETHQYHTTDHNGKVKLSLIQPISRLYWHLHLNSSFKSNISYFSNSKSWEGRGALSPSLQQMAINQSSHSICLPPPSCDFHITLNSCTPIQQENDPHLLFLAAHRLTPQISLKARQAHEAKRKQALPGVNCGGGLWCLPVRAHFWAFYNNV